MPMEHTPSFPRISQDQSMLRADEINSVDDSSPIQLISSESHYSTVDSEESEQIRPAENWVFAVSSGASVTEV